MKVLSVLIVALVANLAFGVEETLWLEDVGETPADSFLAMRERLKALRTEKPGVTVRLRTLDAPASVVDEMRKFTNGTDVVWGDEFVGIPATRVLQSGGGGTRPPGWWEDRLARNRKLIKASGGKIDIVFLGDSITHFWERRGAAVYAELTNRYSVLNCGYGGDSTRHLIWREINGELDGYEAKCAMVMIGTNNRGDPGEIARSIEKTVRIVRKRQPKAKVLLLAIFPRGADASNRDRQRNDKINALIRGLADGKDVFWMDLADRFLEPDGKLPKRLFFDYLHPSADGYRIWLDAVRPFFEQHVR